MKGKYADTDDHLIPRQRQSQTMVGHDLVLMHAILMFKVDHSLWMSFDESTEETD